MFNDKRLRNIFVDADETQFKLGTGYHEAKNDNKSFQVDLSKPNGDKSYGRMLLDQIPHNLRQLDLRNSLEVCCGNGFLFFSLKQLCKWDFSSHFIDISMSQIKDFANRCQNSEHSPPQMLVGDVLELPYPNESFNLVYGNSFLHHLPDVGAGLKEFSRILRPSGFFISFHEPTHMAPLLENIPARLKQLFFPKQPADSLTDIWLFKPYILSCFVKKCGFSSVLTIPKHFFSSFFVSPIRTGLGEIGLPRYNKTVLRAMILCDKLDKLVPQKVRRNWAPSLAIIATK